jgi:hypothetical protein
MRLYNANVPNDLNIMTSPIQSGNKIQIMMRDMQKYYQKARGMDVTKSKWVRSQILLLRNVTNKQNTEWGITEPFLNCHKACFMYTNVKLSIITWLLDPVRMSIWDTESALTYELLSNVCLKCFVSKQEHSERWTSLNSIIGKNLKKI